MRRVVITGVGSVTPLGSSFPEAWKLVKQGVSGISPVTKFDVADLPWRVGGEVKDFRTEEFFTTRDGRGMDLFALFAAAASTMAAQDAGLMQRYPPDRTPLHDAKLTSSHLQRAGLMIGSSRGGIVSLEREMVRALCGWNSGKLPRMSPFLMPGSTVSAAASFSAQVLGSRGICLGLSNACASGTNAIGEAFRLVRDGYADVILAGGAEAPLCKTCFLAYGSAGALSRVPGPSASRPFDKSRDGFVLAEGAVILVLEELETAKRRSARIHGEIIGYGQTADALHMTRPSVDGESRAMMTALKDAGCTAEDVNYVSAHGTSTVLGDLVEAEAIRRVFPRGIPVPVSALKSMTGHMLAASGAFEAACTLMSLKEGVIPPTINLEDHDPKCGISVVTEEVKGALDIAVSNSFGFGGVNAVLVMKRHDTEYGVLPPRSAT
jgi:3-oxoacyl-[acyl-carrier-protein] synthase II